MENISSTLRQRSSQSSSRPSGSEHIQVTDAKQQQSQPKASSKIDFRKCALTASQITFATCLTIAVIVTFCYNPSDDTAIKNHDSRIILGDHPPPKIANAAVLLRIGTPHSVHVCTASILNRYNLMSAAHCFTDMNGTGFPVDSYIKHIDVYIGLDGSGEYNEFEYYGNAVPAGVQKIVITNPVHGQNVHVNPQYYDTLSHKSANKYNFADMAVLTLPEEINYKKTSSKQVTLFNPGETHGAWYPNDLRALAVGWGLTHIYGAEELQMAEIRSMSWHWCKEKAQSLGYPDDTMDVDDMFCGWGETIGTQICYGDSGGPLFLEYEGELVQLGVNVWVDAMCQEEFNGFVRIQPHMSWLESVIKRMGGEELKQVNFDVLVNDGKLESLDGESSESLVDFFEYESDY